MWHAYSTTFITMEIIFIIIVMILAHKMSNDVGTISEIRHFRILQAMFVVGAATQILWMLNHSGDIYFARWLIWLINMINGAALGICMYQWFRFIAEKVLSIQKYKKILLIIQIQRGVLILQLLFIMSSFWTKWVFYIDQDSMYQRGKYFWVYAVICYSYWIWTTLLLLSYRKNATLAGRRNLDHMLIASILPVIGGIFQLLNYGVPFADASLMLANLIIFINLQEEHITTDALTGLNNRLHLVKTYERLAGNADTHPFTIFVMDINKFKRINDTYGHIKGNEALVTVADGLKHVGKNHPTIRLFRYGGDEFVIIAPKKEVEDPDRFTEEINEILLETEKKANLEFKVLFSIGYYTVTDKTITSQYAFSKADQMLYEQKRKQRIS